MFTLIQKRYDFTNYQIAQLKYTFTILFSELSKFVLISFFYRNQLGVYLYALILLSVLRLSTGGLHAKTYWGCFLMSFIFFWLAIKLLPQIDVPKVVMVILIISGMAAIYRIGPVASVFRMQPEGIMKKRLITARNLLRDGCTVMEACLQSGFNDYSNFLKAFKREFGKNPSQYFPD